VKRPLGAAVLGLALCAGLGRWNLRPELATYLMVAVFLAVLGGRARGRALWVLPALQVLWVNLHTLFVMGPILAWTFAGGAAVVSVWRRGPGGGESGTARGSLIRLLAVAVLVTAACWVNPYGTRGVMYVRELWSESSAGHAVAETIKEMKSPLAIPLARWPWDLNAAAVLAVVGAGTFVRNRRRLNLARLVVFGAGVFLFLKAARNEGLLALMAGWAALRNIEEAESEQPVTAGSLTVLWHSLVAAAGVSAAWYIATDRYWVRIGAPMETGIGVVSWGAPEGAAAFLSEAGPAPNLFNGVRDGGYLIWRLEGRAPVFVDGRTDVYGPELLNELVSVKPATWAALAERRGIRTAVFPVSGFEDMVRSLAAAGSGWVLVHLDHRNVVFVRDVPENSAVIAARRIDLRKPWGFPERSPDAGEVWKHAIGGRGRPWYWNGMADTFLALGSIENAAAALRRVVESKPDSRPDRIALADACFQLGDFARARDHYRRALAGTTGPGPDWKKLGYALEKTGDDAGAADAYRVSIAADPQAETCYLLGLSLARRRDRAGAALAFSEALRLKPDYPAAKRALEAVQGGR
jgi:hypothetical protein